MKNTAYEMNNAAVKLRRLFHQRPDTRWETEWTRGQVVKIAHECRDIDRGREARWTITKKTGGIVVDYDIDPGNARRILRADMDALPVSEQTGAPYASQNPGKMHACGHDGHLAMLLTAMRLIANSRVSPKRNIRFVFDDAEEGPGGAPRPESGIQVLIEEGVLEGVDDAFGLHLMSTQPSGTFASRDGGLMANSDRFGVKITARGGHVMAPDRGTNAMDVAADVATAFRSAGARLLDAVEPHTIVCTGCQSGAGQASGNIIPASADLWFGVRTMLKREDREVFLQRLCNIAEQVGMAWGVKVECTPVRGHDAIINSGWADIRDLLNREGLVTETIRPKMGGESFGLLLQKVPGCLTFLGAGKRDNPDHHSPMFDIDENVLWMGVLYWLLLVTS